MDNTFMMGQVEQYPKSVTDSCNMMLHFKEDTGQRHYHRTVRMRRGEMMVRGSDANSKTFSATSATSMDTMQTSAV